MTSPPLVAGLATLEPLERDAIVLSYFYEQTQRQIAESLAVPRAAVARAIANALHRLSLFLADVHEPES